MKTFAFHREAKWIIIFGLAGPVMGIVFWLIVWVLRKW
jgi:hypothetical protein